MKDENSIREVVDNNTQSLLNDDFADIKKHKINPIIDGGVSTILPDNSHSGVGGEATKLRKRNLISIQDFLVKSKMNLSSNYTMVSYSKQNYKVNKCTLIGLILLSACGTFFMGYNEAVFDTMQEHMKDVFEWGDDEGDFELTLISTLITAGAMIGSFVSGYMTNSLGRLKSFLLLDFLSCIGTVLTLIQYPYAIIGGRLIVGFSVGGYTYVARLYMAEMSPIQMRGINIAIIEMFYMIGITVAYAFGFGLDLSHNWWRIMFGFNLVICGIHFLVTLFFFNFETPIYHYLSTEDQEATKKILGHIFKNQEDIIQLSREIKRVSKEKREQNKISYLDLFKEKYRARMFVCIILIIASIFVGIDALIYFSDFIFIEYVSHSTGRLYTNILGFAQMVASIVAVTFVEHLGRKRLLVIGHLSIFVILGALGILYLIDLTSPIIYMFTILISINAITVNPVTNIYLTDVLPEKGLALCYAIYYLAKLVLTSTFKVIVLSELGYPGLFWIYALLTLGALAFVLFRVKETQGKTIIQLDELY